MRLRAGKTGSGKGAGRMVAQAIATARAAGTSGKILVRGDSAYGNRAVVRACRRGKVQFSLVMAKNRAIQRPSTPSPQTNGPRCATPTQSQTPTPRAWISDAEVALHRVRLHPRPDHRPAGGAQGQRRPLPRRAVPGLAVSPVLHQLRTATVAADIVHRRHAVIETVFADLIDGPLAHLPRDDSAPTPHGYCALPSPTTCLTPPGHPPATLTASPAARPCADGSSPCRPDSPAPHAHRSCTCHGDGPGLRHGYGCGNRSSARPTGHHLTLPDRRPGPNQPKQWKSWADQQLLHASHTNQHQLL